MQDHKYLKATRMLDYNHPSIQKLIKERGWAKMDDYDRLGAAYAFVKDEILFGYNASDDIPASQILADGYGQCNTKATLFMALARGLGLPCRARGAKIDKELQRGTIPALFHRLAPRELNHTWAEVLHQDQWLDLEGLILDRGYLDSIRDEHRKGPLCAFAVAVPDMADLQVEWQGQSTYVQHDAVSRDLGAFDSPDDFYAAHGANLSGLKRLIYARLVRRLMNANVAKVRAKAQPARVPGQIQPEGVGG